MGVPMKALRILVANDNATIRKLLRERLESEPGWIVCGEAVDGHDAISAHGLRFVLPKAPKNGSTVETLMTFPNQLTHERPVRALCNGHVMRTSLDQS